MRKVLIVEITDGSEYWIRDGNVDAIFDQFKLPPPEQSKPAISMELRGAIATYGITIPIEDGDEVRINAFFPPYQIKRIFFVASKHDLGVKMLTKLLKDNR